METRYIEKIYGRKISRKPGYRFKVIGKPFTRTLYSEEGQPDLLVDQFIEKEPLYKHEKELLDVWRSSEHLYQKMLALPPTLPKSMLRHLILRNKNDLGWSEVARYMSNYAKEMGVFRNIYDRASLLKPFRVEGEHTFGKIQVLSKGSIRSYWGNQLPLPMERVTSCLTCHELYNFDGAHLDLVIKLAM